MTGASGPGARLDLVIVGLGIIDMRAGTADCTGPPIGVGVAPSCGITNPGAATPGTVLPPSCGNARPGGAIAV